MPNNEINVQISTADGQVLKYTAIEVFDKHNSENNHRIYIVDENQETFAYVDVDYNLSYTFNECVKQTFKKHFGENLILYSAKPAKIGHP